MKISNRKNHYPTLILLLAFPFCACRALPQSEAEHQVESARPLTQENLSAVGMAIEDEIYEYSQEKSYFRHGSAAKNVPGRTVKVSVYINPRVAADGLGEAIYNNMPYGEIVRAFYVQPTGMVVLAGGPQVGFPVTQPSHLTKFMDKDELSDDKAQWLHAELTIQENPSESTLVQAARRQVKRVGFSHYGRVPPRGVGAVGNSPAGATVQSLTQAGELSTAAVIAGLR
jgi:hypothetical protein